MGKVRVKTLGDEEQEQKQQAEAKKRAEAKKADSAKQNSESSSNVIAREPAAGGRNDEGTTRQSLTNDPSETASPEVKSDKPKKKEKFQKTQKASHSQKYAEKSELVDKNKVYKLSEALEVLPKVTYTKFDATVELHMNTNGTVSGAVILPHGTGKQVRVAIADGSNVKEVEELVKKIEGGTIDFDVLIATPDAMPKLARIARVLGPRGLMPNPKNGTVSPKPEEVAKKFAGGQMNFKTEAKAPILHMVVGKMSFGDKKLQENITVALQTVQTKNIKNATLKSTMSPGIKIDFTNI